MFDTTSLHLAVAQDDDNVELIKEMYVWNFVLNSSFSLWR